MTTTDLLLVKLIDCTPLSAGHFATDATMIGLTINPCPFPRKLNFQGMPMTLYSITRSRASYTNKGRTCVLRISTTK